MRALEVTVPAGDVDLVSGLLWSTGVTAIAEDPVEDGAVVLRTDVPPDGVAAVSAVVGSRGEVREVVVDDDGFDQWRRHAEVVVGRGHLVVRPPWVPLDATLLPRDPIVVEIDPGRAWGHGGHPTTRLCLHEVERACRDRVGMSVLDLGCGSGVLGIAAARLGATSVVARDVDPMALDVTAENARRNGVADRVAISASDDALGGPFDLIVANIGARALVDLAPAILDAAADDGLVVLSGLLEPLDPAVLPAFGPWRAVRVELLDEWLAVVLVSPTVSAARLIGDAPLDL